eukprot:56029-Prymnesium_polylepis.1
MMGSKFDPGPASPLRSNMHPTRLSFSSAAGGNVHTRPPEGHRRGTERHTAHSRLPRTAPTALQ